MGNGQKGNETQLYTVFNPPAVNTYFLHDDGRIPNHAHYPVIVYDQALKLSVARPGALIEEVFSSNKWTRQRRDALFDFDQYHSNAHSVLGIVRGNATLQFGGENGVEKAVQPGDVIIIPAGVAFRSLAATRDFKVVGAYPPGPAYDICYGKPEERPQADRNIGNAPFPDADPVYGDDGPLFRHWSQIR